MRTVVATDFDADGDGVLQCDADPDCNDGDDTSGPSADEQCDPVDHDCDGDFVNAVNHEAVIEGGGAGTPILDNSTFVVTATVASTDPIQDLDVRFGIQHTFAADLEITLTSPAGTVVALMTDHGGGGDDLVGTTLDDEAATAFSTTSSDDAPFLGRWNPEEPLAAFDGEDPSGDWSLSVTDDATVDEGELLSWQLHFSTAEVGFDEACPAPSCESILLNHADPATGVWWIDPTGGGAFEVQCDMDTDGGGWIVVGLDDTDSLLVGTNANSNPWDKCADDSASPYSWIAGEASVSEDYFGSVTTTVVPDYLNEASGSAFCPELADLRAHATQLSDTTRMVGQTADADGGDYLVDGYGHEVWVYNADGDVFEVTPGTNGQCGHSTGWPWGGSESDFYWWSTSGDANAATGDNGGFDETTMAALPSSFVIPTEIDLVVATGGGVSFGWESELFLVK
ncbi:MAG: hypothetical protein GY898_32175 [Proteobacteria bacterium]|nr:hypothetical protein [Pseudomonadota bacterium]